MSVRPLRVFVSSKMQELADERQAIKAALDDMRVESFVFEADAGARPQTIEETFLEEVEGADLYIGVFWRGYGRYTIEEYDRATALGMDCLIYEKREAVDGQRDRELAAFLERLGDVEAGLTVKWFHTPAQLADSVKEQDSSSMFHARRRISTAVTNTRNVWSAASRPAMIWRSRGCRALERQHSPLRSHVTKEFCVTFAMVPFGAALGQQAIPTGCLRLGLPFWQFPSANRTSLHCCLTDCAKRSEAGRC
jgi:hypothetical protein